VPGAWTGTACSESTGPGARSPRAGRRFIRHRTARAARRKCARAGGASRPIAVRGRMFREVADLTGWVVPVRAELGQSRSGAAMTKTPPAGRWDRAMPSDGWAGPGQPVAARARRQRERSQAGSARWVVNRQDADAGAPAVMPGNRRPPRPHSEASSSQRRRRSPVLAAPRRSDARPSVAPTQRRPGPRIGSKASPRRDQGVRGKAPGLVDGYRQAAAARMMPEKRVPSRGCLVSID